MATLRLVVVSAVLVTFIVSQSRATAASQAARPSSQPAPVKPSLIGMTLSATANEDFFTWFRLQETVRERDGAGRDLVVFKPSGGAFRKMVTVRATLGPRERIVGMELALARAFIDSANRPFANDIAASMLRDSLSLRDLEALRDLVNEIQHRGVRRSDGPPTAGSIAVPRSGPIELPANESAGYLTYAGKRDSYTQQLPSTLLVMEKTQDAGEAWLRIRLSSKS
jgi:hypothetical protein